jgi:hypothetical protein
MLALKGRWPWKINGVAIKMAGLALKWSDVCQLLNLLCPCWPSFVCVTSASERQSTEHDITQRTVKPDWYTFVWSTIRHYKRYDKADCFMYSDFCISVTTRKNPTRHTKSMNNCGKEKRDTRHKLAFEGKRIWCCACYSKTNKNETQASRMQRGVACYPDFEVYHSTLHFWGPTDTKLEGCGFYKWLHERKEACKKALYMSICLVLSLC